MFDEDYQRDFNAGMNGGIGNVNSAGYAAGEAARARADERHEKIQEAGRKMGIELRANPLKFLVGAVVQTVSAAVFMGLIFAALAVVQGHPPLEWAIPAAGVTAALFVIVLAAYLAGFALGILFIAIVNVVSLPFVLWRWVVVFGGIAAGVGYLLATSASRSTTLAQQQALDYAWKGALAGIVVGGVIRLMRALSRRGRSRVSPRARA